MGDRLVTRHCTESAAATFHGDQWVLVEVEVHGSREITHFVNGTEVLSYSAPRLDRSDGDAKALIGAGDPLLDRGSISLQAESHPVEFRRVELEILDET